ncbi:hypothetical protein FRC03_009535 [Tulasnella sp. 419]|nr:hypothetical protein FRC03_009535 [Tulasnella sp. 419]
MLTRPNQLLTRYATGRHAISRLSGIAAASETRDLLARSPALPDVGDVIARRRLHATVTVSAPLPPSSAWNFPADEIKNSIASALKLTLEIQTAYGQVLSVGKIAQSIKGAFDQAGANTKETEILSKDITDLLHRIQDTVEQPSMDKTPHLRQDLASFVHQLRDILGHCNGLMKRKQDGYWENVVSRSREIYNANSIRDELIALRQRIQSFAQNLQFYATLRIDNGVANNSSRLEAIEGKLDYFFLMLSPGQLRTIEVIDEKLEVQITEAENDDASAQELIGAPSMSATEASQSLKETEEALEAGSPTSDTETKYLKLKIKALRDALPNLNLDEPRGNQPSASSTPVRSRWVTHYTETGRRDGTREDSVQESIRTIKLLRSGHEISYVDSAKALGRLSLKLGDLDMWEEAAEIGAWVVDIRQKLVTVGNVESSIHLAAALNNLSKWLSKVGRYKEALTAAEESVAISRHCATLDPSIALPVLASSLNNSSSYLNKVGRREDALKASQESVDIRRQLVKTQPTHTLPDLALSLSNLSPDLNHFGKFEDAVKASEESVATYRNLVKERPSRFLPYLLRSLDNLSVDLTDSGRYKEALKASEESVGIARKLAKGEPTRFRPDLARSLGALHVVLGRLGRYDDSFNVLKESVSIYKKLAKEQPVRYTPNIAASLYHLASVLSELGRYEDALRAKEESIIIYRRLFSEQGTSFLIQLVDALNDSAWYLYRLGRHHEMTPRVEEIKELLSNGLNRDSSGLDREGLARCYDALAVHLSILDQKDEATIARQECLDISQTLYQKQTDMHASAMSMYLLHRSRALRGYGDLEEPAEPHQGLEDHDLLRANEIPLKYNSEPKEILVHVGDTATKAGEQ